MFNWFKREPKCYGDYKWETKCEICEYVNKCIDFTNTYRSGTRVKLTNKTAPPATPRQINKVINFYLGDNIMDIEELKKNIDFEINNNIVIHCDKGKHKFVPVGDGTLDVKCAKCGIKAMRATIKIK